MVGGKTGRAKRGPAAPGPQAVGEPRPHAPSPCPAPAGGGERRWWAGQEGGMWLPGRGPGARCACRAVRRGTVGSGSGGSEEHGELGPVGAVEDLNPCRLELRPGDEAQGLDPCDGPVHLRLPCRGERATAARPTDQGGDTREPHVLPELDGRGDVVRRLPALPTGRSGHGAHDGAAFKGVRTPPLGARSGRRPSEPTNRAEKPPPRG